MSSGINMSSLSLIIFSSSSISVSNSTPFSYSSFSCTLLSVAMLLLDELKVQFESVFVSKDFMLWGTGKGFITLRLWNLCRRLSALKLGSNVLTGSLALLLSWLGISCGRGVLQGVHVLTPSMSCLADKYRCTRSRDLLCGLRSVIA